MSRTHHVMMDKVDWTEITVKDSKGVSCKFTKTKINIHIANYALNPTYETVVPPNTRICIHDTVLIQTKEPDENNP